MTCRHVPFDPALIVEAVELGHSPLGPTPSALPRPLADHLRRAFSRHGIDPESGLQLISALLRLSRSGSLVGLIRILPAFEVLLRRSTARHLQLRWPGVAPYHALFAAFGRVLREVDLILPQLGLGKTPRLREDRIRYGLWRATRRPTPPAAPHLLERCRRALWRAELDPSYASPAARGQLDRLPYELAVLVRKFPVDRLPEHGGFLAELRRRDVERAFDRYLASRRGLQTLPAKAECVRNVERALGIRQVVPCGPSSTSSAAWPALRHLSEEGDRDVVVELETDDDGALRGLLAIPVPHPDDVEHPLEWARWIDPNWGGRWVRPLARTEWFPNITDGRAPTPNELSRTIGALDDWIHTAPRTSRPKVARLGFFVGAIAWTGLLLKRLLRAQLWTGDPDLLPGLLRDGRMGGDVADLVLIVPRLRVLLCHAEGPLVQWGENGEQGPLPPLIPVPLPAFLWEWADLAWGADSASAHRLNSWAFPHRSGRRVIDLSELTPFLGELSVRARLLEPLSWPRLRRTLRTYAREVAQASPLLAALASGAPTRQEQVELHYVSFTVADFVRRCRTMQDGIWEFAALPPPRGGRGGLRAGQFYESRPPSWLQNATLGARFRVDDEDLRAAWTGTERAIAEASSSMAYMNRLTVGVASLLIAGAGVRECELWRITESRLDLDAGVLRLEGKPNGVFLEAREIPLNRYLCEAVRRYLAVRKRLVPNEGSSGALFWVYLDGWRPLEPGNLDRLIEQEDLFPVWRFSPRLLRHWLRTRLDSVGLAPEVIREPFGHVTETDSTWHELSHFVLSDLHAQYRAGTARALEQVMDRERLSSGLFFT